MRSTSAELDRRPRHLITGPRPGRPPDAAARTVAGKRSHDIPSSKVAGCLPGARCRCPMSAPPASPARASRPLLVARAPDPEQQRGPPPYREAARSGSIAQPADLLARFDGALFAALFVAVAFVAVDLAAVVFRAVVFVAVALPAAFVAGAFVV